MDDKKDPRPHLGGGTGKVEESENEIHENGLQNDKSISADS